MKKKNTSSDSPLTPSQPPPLTRSKRFEPYTMYLDKILDWSIFNNSNTLRLFMELCRNAPPTTRDKTFDKDELVLGPRQGTFAARNYSHRMRLSRVTIWSLMRKLESENFIKRDRKLTYSIYTITGKGLKKPEDLRLNTDSSTLEPPSQPPRGAHSQESRVKSQELSKTKRTVPRKELKILIHQKDFLKAQSKILKSSLCSEPDLGLPEDLRTWLFAGICAKNQGQCQNGRTVCVPFLKMIAAKIIGRKKQEPIRFPKTYAEQSVNEYFYPELFYEQRGR